MALSIKLNCEEAHSLSCNSAAHKAKGRWLVLRATKALRLFAAIGAASLVTEAARSAKLRVSLGSSYSRRLVSSCATNEGLRRPLKN